MTFSEIVRDGCKEWDLPVTEDAIVRMERFSDALIEKNRVMNLTAVTEPEEIARRHMLDCLFLLTCADFQGKKILDIGCGAGFPTMPLKCYDPSFDITPLENHFIMEYMPTAKGDFAYPGNIDLPAYRDLAGNFVTNLTLTEAYWFDIDPTGSNWCFRAGTCEAPHEVVAHFSEGPGGNPVYDPTGTADFLIKTNVRMAVYMVITNESTVGEQAGLAWSPYMLRGMEPGSDSRKYASGETNAWDSVNFKMTGDPINGKPLREKWVPLRYFVFAEGSFAEDHTSVVEIPHPLSPDSLGINYGWDKYIDQKPPVMFGYKWSIDPRVAPVAIEVLRPTNIITW